MPHERAGDADAWQTPTPRHCTLVSKVALPASTSVTHGESCCPPTLQLR